MIALPGAWADAAKDCTQGQDIDRQIRGCTEIITKRGRGNLVAAYNNRCSAYQAKGDFDKAIADCDNCNRAVQLDPDKSGVLGTRGMAYLKLGDLSNAQADFDAKLRVDAKDADCLYGLGLVKLKKGDTDAGNADMTAAKAIDAGVAETWARYVIWAPRWRALSFQAPVSSTG